MNLLFKIKDKVVKKKSSAYLKGFKNLLSFLTLALFNVLISFWISFFLSFVIVPALERIFSTVLALKLTGLTTASGVLSTRVFPIFLIDSTPEIIFAELELASVFLATIFLLTVRELLLVSFSARYTSSYLSLDIKNLAFSILPKIL